MRNAGKASGTMSDDRPQWLIDRENRAADLRKSVKVGSRVRVSAQFTPVSGGIVDEVSWSGIRIGKLWFGWHEVEL